MFDILNKHFPKKVKEIKNISEDLKLKLFFGNSTETHEPSSSIARTVSPSFTSKISSTPPSKDCTTWDLELTITLPEALVT